jgi:ubiquinone/menaquinone biosynthesis C-methylase UbiE
LARTNASWAGRRTAEWHFAAVAPRYHSLRDTDHDAVLLIRDRLPDRPLVGVDIGAGTGRYSTLLQRALPARSSLIAADLSHAMLRALGAEAEACAMVLRCAAEQLPLADHSVDFVTTFNAIHHFDLDRFAHEVARVLSRRGDLFVYTRTPEQNAASIWGRAFPGFTTHENRLHDETTLERAFAPLGTVEMRRFSFARRATPARLAERVRGYAYSTFRCYEPDQLQQALDRFLGQLNGHDVEWHDHNLLVHVRRHG